MNRIFFHYKSGTLYSNIEYLPIKLKFEFHAYACTWILKKCTMYVLYIIQMRQLLKHCSYQSNTQVCIVALCGLCSPRRGLVSSAGQELSAFIPSTVVFNALPMQNRLSQIICMQHATKRVCYEEEAVFHHHHRSLLLPF